MVNFPRNSRHSRLARSATFAALAAATFLTSSAFADYSALNTFDLLPVGFSQNQAITISANFQFGTGTSNVTSLDRALLWNSSNLATDITPANYDTGRVLGTDGAHLVGSGSSVALTTNRTQALLWNGTAGSFTNLNPAGYVASYANAVLGTQQVGAATNMTGPIQNYHAALWNGTAGSFVDLNPTGFIQSVATGTNGTQQIGYGGGTATGDKVHAILWNSSSGNFTDLTPAGYDYAFGQGIGKTQQVGYGGGTITGGKDNALLWNGTASSFISLNPTGYLASVANATNDFQQVGYGFGPNATNSSHALLWNGAADNNVDLHLLLPGTPTSSVATAIDPWGNASGYAVYAGANHAVAWLAGNVFKGAPGASNWTTAANWTSGLPAAGNDLLVISSDGNSRTLNFSSANPALTFNKLTIDSLNGPAITVSQSQDTLNANTETIGLVGAGAFTQSGGTHNATTLSLGARAGSTGSYNLSGTASSLAATSMSFLRGSYNQSGGTATANSVTFAAGFNFNLSGGTFQTPTLNLSAAPVFNFSGGTLYLTNTTSNPSLIGATTFAVPAGGTLKMGRGLSLNTLSVGGKVQFLPTPSGSINNGTTKVNALTIAGTTNAWTGQVDLANNALVIQTSGGSDKTTKLANLTNQVFSGRAGGTWTGNGVTSSTILSTPNTSLAVINNADLHLTGYRGATGLDDNSLIVVQAHNGDATLDNKVDALDLNIVAAHWQQQSGGFWSGGDFTGDGKVDALDLNILAANWQFAGSLEAALSDFPQFSGAPVPEPASLGLVALGAVGLLVRRRPRS